MQWTAFIRLLAADEPGALNPSHLIAFGGLLLITLGLMMRLRKRARRRAGEPSAHEKVERMRQMRGMRGDLEDLMVEIDQLARRFGAQLDAKGLQLERLIEEADRRIARLEALGRAPDGPVEEQPTPEDPLARSVYDLADKGADATKIAHELNEHVGKVELILALRNAG